MSSSHELTRMLDIPHITAALSRLTSVKKTFFTFDSCAQANLITAEHVKVILHESKSFRLDDDFTYRTFRLMGAIIEDEPAVLDEPLRPELTLNEHSLFKMAETVTAIRKTVPGFSLDYIQVVTRMPLESWKLESSTIPMNLVAAGLSKTDIAALYERSIDRSVQHPPIMFISMCRYFPTIATATELQQEIVMNLHDAMYTQAREFNNFNIAAPSIRDILEST